MEKKNNRGEFFASVERPSNIFVLAYSKTPHTILLLLYGKRTSISQEINALILILSVFALNPLLLQGTSSYEDLPDECTHPMESGPCRFFMGMWYFNTTVDDCVPFAYGGCMGNQNKFGTKRRCLRKCKGCAVWPKSCFLEGVYRMAQWHKPGLVGAPQESGSLEKP